MKGVGCVIALDPDLAKFFLWDEIVLRLFSGHHQRHSQWYAFLYIYVPVLLCGTLPWTYYVVKGSMRTFQTAKQEFKTGGNERGSENIFLMLWFFIPMVIFIISRSNLPLYVLPLFVPLAIMAAREMERRGLSFFKIRYQIALWCVLIVLARPFMASLNFGKDSSRFAKLIHAKYPHPVEEIVFAGTRAALGLQFYTGSNIEQISMESPELENELNEKETRLWVVLDKEAEHFRTRIRNLDRTMIELGPIKAWNNYVLFAEVSDTINVRS